VIVLERAAQSAKSYENMSDDELYSLLKEKAPAVAEVVENVGDSNRATIKAILILLVDETN
jgi:hypothetical protein